MAGFSPRKILTWVLLMLSLVAVGIVIHRLRGNAAQPTTQAELDAARGYGAQSQRELPRIEIQEKNDAYYAQAIGISYEKKDCGTRVENAVVVVGNHAFSDRVLIALSGDGELRRVEHPSHLPLAYLPIGGNPISDGDPLIFNPKARDVPIKKRKSHMHWLAARLTWNWIDYSGLLRLPASGGPSGTLDGSSLQVMVCRNGLHYDFIRVLNGYTPEPQLQWLIERLERYAPDIDDGP